MDTGQNIPYGTYMVSRISGKISRAGLIWFPASRPNSPRGTPTCFTIVFQHFLFTQNTWHLYHVEAHLSGYVLLAFHTPTSITAGVGGGEVGATRSRCGHFGVRGESGLFLSLWLGSRAGYRVLIGSRR